MLQINTKAPDFTSPDHLGTTHSLSNYIHNWILLYFYPKDDTPGCTQEACTLRDFHTEYKKHTLIVIGISKDTILSHHKFITKYNLPFILLSDTDSEVINLYNADGIFLPKRVSYLINPKGEIVKIYTKVNPKNHAEEVLFDLEKLTK